MKDKFSRQAELYAKYRPSYPQSLFEFLLQYARGRQNAWDCATGNGQTAKVLAGYFDNVFATDISQNQIDNAESAGNIHYSVQPAEQTNFEDNSFDLISVSQALHWFNFDEFYREVNRVGRPGSLIAVWMYSLLRISKEIDPIIEKYHFERLGGYWDPERKHVDRYYETIPFPFPEISAPGFSMEYDWTPEELEGYFNTWSALQRFMTANQYNPVPDLIQKIREASGNRRLRIIFPIHLRIGRVEK